MTSSEAPSISHASELPAPLPGAGGEPLSSGLLSFYDRLRGRVTRWLGGRAGRAGTAAGEALMLVPDVFFLLLRLSLAPEVPRASRGMLAAGLAYFVLPVDLMPEAALGAPGYLEDLVLAAALLAQAFGDDLEPVAERYWSGSGKLRQVLGDVTRTADKLLSADLHGRLQRLLAKRGFELR